MKKLCVFNPDHDLCLANGDKNFVPPTSALRFGEQCHSIMQCIYPDAETTAYTLPFDLPEDSTIIPWGWNVALKQQLLRHGVSPTLLPTDEYLDWLRNLQHRSSILELQPQSTSITTPTEAEENLSIQPHWVLKAPWSGSGRGIRWISNELSNQDRHWIEKITREQRCVIIEPRRKVLCDFALEYQITDKQLKFIGYSLFENQSGIYRRNLLLSDTEIEQHLLKLCQKSELLDICQQVENWLILNVAPRYNGPLGADFYIDDQQNLYLSEINFRHTMGLAAHEGMANHNLNENQFFK